MKQIIFKESFLKTISDQQHLNLLAIIRIYAVLSMKCKNVVDTLYSKNLNNGEFIDLYSDLFATFLEGSKKYFQNYSGTILEILRLPKSEYAKKMEQIFAPDKKDKNKTYKILAHIRNSFSFHFGTQKLNPIYGAPIGLIDDAGKVTFTSITPHLFRFISAELNKDISQETIQTFYRTVYNKEVIPFLKYLEGLLHLIIDDNVDYI